MAALAQLGEVDRALAELRAAIDAGYRSIMFERVVRMDVFKMLSSLHEIPDFQSMIAEIETDNARMLRKLRRGISGS